jgi:hypothetical protein
MKISLQTSVDDLQSSFRGSIEYYTTSDFEKAIEEEEKGQNRVTVKKLLKRCLNKKKLGGRRL